MNVAAFVRGEERHLGVFRRAAPIERRVRRSLHL